MNTQTETSPRCALADGSAPTDVQIEKAARAIARAYVQGFRHANPHISSWITTLDEAVDLQWEMVCKEALEALLPNAGGVPRPESAPTPKPQTLESL